METRCMQSPKVSLVWLNYNSSHIISLIEESLNAMINLDYPNYEIIVVDNASTDGSFEFIRNLMQQALNTKSIGIKIIRNGENLGFVGGMNSGFRARDPQGDYVALVNNDAVITPNSISILIREMDGDKTIGVTQGVVSNLDCTMVDSAGIMIDELLNPRFIFDQEPIKPFTPMEVSFAEGTFLIYRISAIEAFLKGSVFIPEGFMYSLEDMLNGLMLWNKEYRCITFPYVVAKHYRRATIKKFRENLHEEYHQWKNRTALLTLTDSKYKGTFERTYEKAIVFGYNLLGKNEAVMDIRQGIFDGHELGLRLKKKYGFNIRLNKCPFVRLGDMGANIRLVRKIIKDRSKLYRIPYV